MIQEYERIMNTWFVLSLEKCCESVVKDPQSIAVDRLMDAAYAYKAWFDSNSQQDVYDQCISEPVGKWVQIAKDIHHGNR